MEKDEKYAKCIKSASDIMETFLKQNNALDVYEEYFTSDLDENVVSLVGDPPSATVIAVFKDPHVKNRRSVGHISWQPRDGSKVATAHCRLQQSQAANEDLPAEAYIWDLTNPNEPAQILKTKSPLLCIEFNPMETHILAAGCYDGTIALFDTRRGTTIHSDIIHSHKDPVYDLRWIQSKNDTQFMTCSTDGQVMIWDNRSPKEPIEVYSLNLTAERGDPNKYLGILSIQCFDYNQSYGPKKFMVGSEQGIVVSCSSRSRTKTIQIDRPYYAHHGPVCAVERNPFNTKYFLTVGDWTAKIWLDDLQHPIITTNYQSAYLTDGCWSPVRPALFFTARIDGVLDIWDLLYKHSSPALSIKIAECALTSVRAGDGKYLAVGDENGFTHLVELSDSLCGYVDGVKQSPTAERDAMSAMFESESKRVLNLQDSRKEIAILKKQQAAAKLDNDGNDDDGQEGGEVSNELKELEADFLHETGLDSGRKEQPHDDRAMNGNGVVDGEFSGDEALE